MCSPARIQEIVSAFEVLSVDLSKLIDAIEKDDGELCRNIRLLIGIEISFLAESFIPLSSVVDIIATKYNSTRSQEMLDLLAKEESRANSGSNRTV